MTPSYLQALRFLYCILNIIFPANSVDQETGKMCDKAVIVIGHVEDSQKEYFNDSIITFVISTTLLLLTLISHIIMITCPKLSRSSFSCPTALSHQGMDSTRPQCVVLSRTKPFVADH